MENDALDLPAYGGESNRFVNLFIMRFATRQLWLVMLLSVSVPWPCEASASVRLNSLVRNKLDFQLINLVSLVSIWTRSV